MYILIYAFIYIHIRTNTNYVSICTYCINLVCICTYFIEIYVQIRMDTCNMNIKKWICIFETLEKVHVFYMYLQVYDRIFVSILLVYARIARICTYQCDLHFCMPKILTNTCNTCKYEQGYVHIRTSNTCKYKQNTFKYISWYLYVYASACMYMTVCACIF